MAASAPCKTKCKKCEKILLYTEDFKKNFIDHGLKTFDDVNVEQCEQILREMNITTGLEHGLCIPCLFDKRENEEILKIERNKSRQLTCIQVFQCKIVNYSKEHKCLWLIAVFLIPFCLSCFIIPLIKSNFQPFDDINNIPDLSEDTLRSSVKQLKDKFPSLNENLLGKMNSSFFRLKTPGEPFVFLFLHDDTNKKTTDCLVSYTSYLAKKNIFTNTSKSLWMNASEWVQHSSTDNEDLLYEKLIVPLEENKVLVLENLQDLPWSLAIFFHHLCDTENPQITHAMYLLELKVNNDRLKLLTEGDQMVAAEKAMETAWLDVPNSFRAALISRLTTFVDAVLLKSDEGCPSNLPSLQSEDLVRISP